MDRMCSEFLPILTYTKTSQNSSTLSTIQSLRESRRQSRKSRNFSRSLTNADDSRIAQIIQRLVDGDFKSQEEIKQQCRGIGRAQFYMVAERRSSARRCGNPLCAQIQISSKGIFCSGKCAYILSGYARCIGDNDERGINSGKQNSSKLRKSKSSITAPSYLQECNENILIEDVFPFAKLHATEELESFLPQFNQYYKKQRHHRRNTSKDLLLAERSDKKYTIKIDAIHHLIENNQSLIQADRSDDSSPAFEIMNLVRRNSEKFCKQRIKQELSKIYKQNSENQQDLSNFDRDLINAQRSDMQKLNSKNSDDFKKFERDLVHAQRSKELMKEVLELKFNQDAQNQQHAFSFDRDLINAQRSDMQKLNSKISDDFKKFERDLVHAQRSDKYVQKNSSLKESKKFENDLVHAQRSDQKLNLNLKSNVSNLLNFDRDLLNAQRSDKTVQNFLNSKVSDDFKKFDRDLINAERSDQQEQQILNSKISDDFKKVERDLVQAQRSNEQMKEILNFKIDQDIKIDQDLQNFERDLVHAQRSNQKENLNLNHQDSNFSNFENDLVHAQRSDDQQQQQKQVPPKIDDSNQQNFDRDLINAQRSDNNFSNFEKSNSNLEQYNSNFEQNNDRSKFSQDCTHAIFFRCGNKQQNCAQNLNSNLCACGQQMHTYLNFENVNQSCNAYKDVLQNFVTNSISNKNFEQISNLFVEKTLKQLDCSNRSDQSCVQLESQNSNSNLKNEESDQISSNLIPNNNIDFERDLIHAQRSDNQLKKEVVNSDFQILHSDSSLSEFNRDLISASRSDDSNATQIENNDDQDLNSNEFLDRDLIGASRSDDQKLLQTEVGNDFQISNSSEFLDRDLISASRSDESNKKPILNNDDQDLNSSEFLDRDLICASRSDDSKIQQIGNNNNNNDQISNSNEFLDRDLISASRSDDLKIQQLENNNDDQDLNSNEFVNQDLIIALKSDDLNVSQVENNNDDQDLNSNEFLDRDLICVSRSDDSNIQQIQNNNDDQDLNSNELLDRDLISVSRSDNLFSNSFEKATIKNSNLLDFDKDLNNAKSSDNKETHQIINSDMHDSISLNFGQDLIQIQKSENQGLHQIQNSDSFEFDQNLIDAQCSKKICQKLNIENTEFQQSIVQNVIPSNELINALRSDGQQLKQSVDQQSSLNFENDLINASRSDEKCQQLETIDEHAKHAEHVQHVEHIDNELVHTQKSDDQLSQIQEIQNNNNFERDLISAERSNISCSKLKPQLESPKNCDNFDRDLINAKRSDNQTCSQLIQLQNPHIEHVEHVSALNDNTHIEHVEHVNANNNNKKLNNIPKLDLDKKSNSKNENLVCADRSDQSCLKLNSVNQQIQSNGNVLFDDDLTDTSSAYSDDDDVFVEGQNTDEVTRIILNSNKQNDDIEDQDEFLLNDLIFAQRSDKQSQKNHKLIKNNNENDFGDVEKSNLGIEIDENQKSLLHEGDMSKKEKSNFMSLMESAFEFTKNGSQNLNNQPKQKQLIKLDLSSTRDAKIFEENSKNIDKLNNKNTPNAQNVQNVPNAQYVQNVQNVPDMLNQGIDNDENLLMSRCQSLPPCDYIKSPRNLQQGILKKTLSGNYTSMRRKQKVTFGMPQTFYLPPSAEEAPLRMSKRQTSINSKFLEDDNVKKFDQFLQKQQRKITCKVTTEEKNLQDELLKAFKRGCEDSDEEEEICSSPQKKENNNNNNNNNNSLFGELQKSLKIRDDEDDCVSSDDEDLDDFMSSDQRQKQSSGSDEDSDSDCEEWHLPLFQAKGGSQVEMSMYAKMQTFFGECITHNSREWLSAAANGKTSLIAKETACDCSQLAIRNAFQLMMSGRIDEIMTDLDIKCSKEDIENNLTQLIKTMRFRKPLPGQGTPVWNFVLIGLLMALSLNQLNQLQPLFCKNGQYELLTEYVTENGDGMDIQQFMQLKERFVLHTSSTNQ